MSETTATAPASPPAAPAPDAPKPQMEEPLRSLDPRIQRQVQDAEKSIDRGTPAFAIEVCSNILVKHPGALEVRKVLRKAQKRNAAGKAKGMSKLFGSLTRTPFAMSVGSKLKSNPKAAIEEAEKLITQDPSSIGSLRLVGQAAEALGLWTTAVFAYENVREVDPENIANLLSLGAAHIEAGQAKEAVKVGDRIMELAPNSGDAQALLRRASVAITMEKGKWDEQSDFREKLADKAATVSLEQQARVFNDADTLNQIIVQTKEKIEKEPEMITHYRDLIGYYKQLQQFDDALEWVRKARQQSLGKADTTLEKLESDMMIAAMRQTMTKLEEDVAKHPEDMEKKAKLDDLHKKEFEFRLNQAKSLVDKYPNDYGFRYEHGLLLLESGQVDLAIRELQMARRNPKVSHLAMLNLGRAYKAKGIADLAIEVLTTAKNEMQLMNDLKKETIYELGQVYNAGGNYEKAIDEYKQIYAQDIDYKDVAQIINEYYEKRAKGG